MQGAELSNAAVLQALPRETKDSDKIRHNSRFSARLDQQLAQRDCARGWNAGRWRMHKEREGDLGIRTKIQEPSLSLMQGFLWLGGLSLGSGPVSLFSRSADDATSRGSSKIRFWGWISLTSLG